MKIKFADHLISSGKNIADWWVPGQQDVCMHKKIEMSAHTRKAKVPKKANLRTTTDSVSNLTWNDLGIA